MQRGLITLTPSQIKIILEVLKNTDQIELLIDKLKASSQEETSHISIQTNENDLEIILDNLPAPTPEVSSEIKQLRKTITEKLFEFRS